MILPDEMKGVFETMARNLRKIAAALACLATVLCALPGLSPAEAAEGDVVVAINLETANGSVPAGTGFYRGGDLWLAEDTAKKAGIPLLPAGNGKGYIIRVDDPANVFENKELARLAGKSLNLYFPSAVEDGVSYFNVLGLERITRLAVMDKNGVTLRRMADNEPLPQKHPKPAPKSNGKIKAVWEHVARWNPDLCSEPVISGLDAILPTWFNLTDSQGGMANRASAAYVEEAHRRGWRVWALASNGFSKAMSTELFKNPRAVNLYIARLLAYAKLYNLDGINIDFENLAVSDRAQFVRFVAILSEQLKKAGLHVSVDVHIPSNSNTSKSHDRAALAKHVDHLMLMAYDQHWRTSAVSGSVASLPWVERAVKSCLGEGVPASKLVLGVPFYMRRWEETPVGKGKVSVKAFTLTMQEAENHAARTGAEMFWLEDLGQHYFSFVENGKTHKVWVENAVSIERKLKLIDKYKIAGMAAWRKGHETISVWDTINRIVN